MMKPHCDNCDALITTAIPLSRRVTINPGGFTCVVTLAVRQNTAEMGDPHQLCAACLHLAALEFTKQ